MVYITHVHGNITIGPRALYPGDDLELPPALEPIEAMFSALDGLCLAALFLCALDPMTPFARCFVLAVLLFLFGVASFNFWLMLIGLAIFWLQVLYCGWKIINS